MFLNDQWVMLLKVVLDRFEHEGWRPGSVCVYIYISLSLWHSVPLELGDWGLFGLWDPRQRAAGEGAITLVGPDLTTTTMMLLLLMMML